MIELEGTYKLTVQDLLKRPPFTQAVCIAGKKGLSNTIRWVHILEIAEINGLVSGNELILSTGVGWTRTKDLRQAFLRQLIEKKVSALAIELGTTLTRVPEDLIKLAEEADFPLLIFNEKVRFIDITQDVNGLLLNNQYKIMADLESYSNRLNQLLLQSGAFHKILQFLHHYLNVHVVYRPVQGKIICIPPIENSLLLKQLKGCDTSRSPFLLNENLSYIAQPVEALGYRFADLLIFDKNATWTEYENLVLNRTAIALAQDQLRSLYIEEKRKSRENQWVMSWLSGEQKIGDIERFLFHTYPSIKPNGSVVCMCQVNGKEEEIDGIYYSMILTNLFEQHGFRSLKTINRETIIFVLINVRKKADWKERLLEAVEKGMKVHVNDEKEKMIFAVGRLYDDLEKVHRSYMMAQEVLHLKEKDHKDSRIFYEDLYTERLLMQLNKEELQEFVSDYIGKILEYDHVHHENMLETLSVFLDVNGSKKEAAEKLHIVRQTLYHRINTLKSLLGDDFMKPPKRLALEMAIKAWQLLRHLV